MVNVTYVDGLTMLVTEEGNDGSDPTTGVYAYNDGDIAWILAATALVMIMTPGVGFFYSGLLRRKNALQMIFLSVAVFGVVSFQWFFWGYSLAFSAGGSKFIGNLNNFGLINVLGQPSAGSTRLPALVYCIYQNMFAAITPMLLLGAIAERGRIAPALVFAFVWATLVYDPVACWTWAPNGWAFIMGGLDFAGGGPVHMTSGTGALAYSIWLGRRKGYGTSALAYKPQNTTFVVLGTVFLWFGWFGFNGGSALLANLRATQACIVTNLAASAGGLTWMLLDWRLERKWSAVGFCSGAISGLVGITPASGYVGSPAALAIGVITGFVCNYATKVKTIFGFDDAIDIFATHGIGGFTGSLLTGIFADSRVVGFDGLSTIDGGWINKHYIQLGYQLAQSCAIIGYSFVVTMLICIALDYIPGLSLRVSEEGELIGCDEDQIGEFGYDYAFIRRDVDYTSHNHNIAEKSPAASITRGEKSNGATAVTEPSNEREASAPTGTSA